MRILSIDGGGVLGLAPAMILAELERRAGKPCRDLFDLIAGTSTGGVIACGLAAGTPAETLASLYKERASRIFQRSVARRIRRLGGLVGPKYDNAGLKAELAALLGDAWLSEVVRVWLLVPAYDIYNRQAVFFKSWRDGPDRDMRLRDVALATSSAPTYFPPAIIRGRIRQQLALVDGGLFANNPTLCACIEAHRAGRRIRGVLSLSTGETCAPIQPAAAAGWGALGWVRPVIECMMDGQGDTVDYLCRHSMPRHGYLRPAWRVPDGIEMDSADATSLARLEACGLALRDQMAKAGDFDTILQWGERP